MLTKVERWGSSLALKIPDSFALNVKLENESIVEISLVDDKIIIKPVISQGQTLAELLSGITEQNIHHEIDTGNAVGNEIW